MILYILYKDMGFLKIEILLKSNRIIDIKQNLYIFLIYSPMKYEKYDSSYTFVQETNSNIDGYNLYQYL